MKSYLEFLNESENHNEYSYYGPGSLYPIIKKLVEEGKTQHIISTYLNTLGVDKYTSDTILDRIYSELNTVPPMNNITNESVFVTEEEEEENSGEEEEDGKKKKDKKKKDKEKKDDLDLDLNLDTTDKGGEEEESGEEEEKPKKEEEDDLPDLDIEPSKEKTDKENVKIDNSDVDKELDNIEKDTKKEGPKEEPTSDKLSVLKTAVNDLEKLEKIKAILLESYKNKVNTYNK